MKLIYSYIRALHACIATQLYHLNTFILSCYSGAAHRGTRMFLVTGMLPVAFFCFLSGAFGQTGGAGKTGTGDTVREIRPLRVGDTVPEEFWTDSVTIFENGTIYKNTLSPYRGQPLLIDFWATWCTTCVAHIPDIYEFGVYKKNQMGVLLTTREEADKISGFVPKIEQLQELPFKTLVENHRLAEYFKHVSLPFYVVLNEDGKVQAMFGLKEMDELLVSDLVRDKHSVFKNELTIDTRSFPSLLAQRYSEDPNYYYSFFYPGNNKVFGGGNRKRTHNGKPYSFSMLNIHLSSILTTLLRTKYEQEGIPYHYSFVRYGKLSPEDSALLGQKATFEVAVPKCSDTDVVGYSLSELGQILPFPVNIIETPVEVTVLYKLDEPLKKIHRGALKFSVLSTNLNELYSGEELFAEMFESTLDWKISDRPASLRHLDQTLRNAGVGMRKQKIKFPFLMIGR